MKKLKSGILPEPILVGRAFELKELQLSLDRMLRGKGTTIFITGEAGSGKTRLTNEFLNQARNRGVTVLSGWCLSNAVIPYFPFVEAFESYVSNTAETSNSLESQVSAAKTWLIESCNAQNATAQAWKDQTLAAVTKELLFISSCTPLILFIDDLHWADSASLALLHYIARSITNERIMILATYRSEEITVEEHRHQLVETMRLMGREDLFVEIRLPSLGQGDVGRIAESMLSGRVNEGFVEKLAEESRGNPLFVVESLRMLYEHGDLIQEQGQWRLGVEKFGIPAKVKDIILRRIDSLKSSQRRILDAASVVGEKFDPKLVAAVVSQDDLDVLESLNIISQSTLLVYCEGDYYRFDHAKSREMLYDQIPSPLKKEYHSRIAEKLESDSICTKGFQESDLAYHFTQAGNKEKSIKHSLAAGKDALAKFSNKEALNHFTNVLKIISEDSDYTDERITALEGLGEAFFANSMFKEAIETFEQLSNIATGVVKLRALRRAMDAAFFRGEFTRLLELTKKSEEHAPVDRLEGARVLMNRARAVMFLGNHEAGIKDFEAALRVFEEEYSLPDVARTSLGLGAVHGKKREEKGLARVLRAVTLYNELNDSRGLMDACNRAGQSFGYRMLIKEALDMNEKTVTIGKRIGAFSRMAEAKDSSAWLLEASDDYAGALVKGLEALEYCEKTDSAWTRAMTYSTLVRLYARLGDLEHAEEYYQKLVKMPKEVLSPASGFVQFGLTRAVYFAAMHRWNEANQFFDEYLEYAKSLGLAQVAPSIEIMGRLYRGWILTQQNRTEEAKFHHEKVQKIADQASEHYQHSTIEAMFMTPREIEFGKEFAVRLDVVNVSRKPCTLLSLEGLIPLGLRVTLFPAYCRIHDSSFAMSRILEPFQVDTVKLSFRATRSGFFSLEPRIVYVDDLGQNETFEIEAIDINVHPIAPKTVSETITATIPTKLEFNSESARKAFEFLLTAFDDDYRRLRLPQERSGWRTLIAIAKQGRISKHGLYGFSGGRGEVVSELERLDLVEARIFTGERGRGGKILKLRVNCENEAVRKKTSLSSM